MKTKIFFIRTAPYEYKIKDLNLYESFDVVATLKFDVPLRKDAQNYFKNHILQLIKKSRVYCSPRLRSIQTAKFINKNPTELSYIGEVSYRMSDFIKEEKFFDKNGKPNVNFARKSFVKSLVNSELREPYSHIIFRVEKLMKKISAQKRKTVVVTHGFFLKVIEAYIRNPKIKNSPELLLEYFNGRHETFHFCEGFIASYSNQQFKFGKYIRNKGDKR